MIAYVREYLKLDSMIIVSQVHKSVLCQLPGSSHFFCNNFKQLAKVSRVLSAGTPLDNWTLEADKGQTCGLVKQWSLSQVSNIPWQRTDLRKIRRPDEGQMIGLAKQPWVQFPIFPDKGQTWEKSEGLKKHRRLDSWHNHESSFKYSLTKDRLKENQKTWER